ncbi:MAG: membrane protein insertase YidC [Beijerinckiaceae bacterium]|nr:membrane protein insertase YidC [Beijerinckiaceae bacterium]
MTPSSDNKNMILAIALSAIVFLGWQYFYAGPQMQRQKEQQAELAKANASQQTAQTNPGQTPVGAPPPINPAAVQPASQIIERDAALAQSPRVKIETPRLTGSVSLKGGVIDDLSLNDYQETVDPKSPKIVLFAPEATKEPYYAYFGWLAAGGVKTPDPQTVWSADGAALTPEKPLTLSYDNGAGQVFKRVVSVDRNYLFTVADSVENKGQAPVTLTPYGSINRIGTPVLGGYAVLFEGLLGVMGETGLEEISYSDVVKSKLKSFERVTGGWLGFTDKYWAAALIPDQSAPFTGLFAADGTTRPAYRTVASLSPLTIAPGASATSTIKLFAGAKEVKTINAYRDADNIKQFDLMIDWGWFYFITKPLFQLMTFIHHLVGNFGVTILLVTVLVKAVFFPLASKSYESMAKMKAVQPKIKEMQERLKDDKAAQQQAMMQLYKDEKINPVAGCVPVILQIPVFFALYKVLFVTIEMRHAPFFGWIRDLAAPDPTSIFNLFGLLPIELPNITYLHLGVWPVIMGITMWLQMKMNPEPTDPIQKSVFGWMPIIFTFMLGTFPAGMVIYWAWNNLLSVTQQYFIMKKNGVKVELWDNLRGVFKKKAAA